MDINQRMPKTMLILFFKRCLNHFYLRPNIKLQAVSHAHVNCESSIGVKQNEFEKNAIEWKTDTGSCNSFFSSSERNAVQNSLQHLTCMYLKLKQSSVVGHSIRMTSGHVEFIDVLIYYLWIKINNRISFSEHMKNECIFA